MASLPIDPACAICGQLHGLAMSDLVEQDPSLPVYCGACEARICLTHGRLDCARCSSTAVAQGEAARLFHPAPAVMPGQLTF
jgi:hypothetical protein